MKRLSYITGSERTGILVALIAAVVACIVAFFAGHGSGGVNIAQKDSTAASVRQAHGQHGNKTYTYYYNKGQQQAELFPFDPNTADSTQLLRLGLQPWQVRAVYRYRGKGGIYRRREDFAHVYGLTKGQYRRLEPYIRIGEDYEPASSLADLEDRKSYVRDTVKYPLKLRKGEHVSISTADTTLLMRVPGIGRHFANEIVHYRDRLGGYYSVQQLREISGFPEEALSYLALGTPRFRRINVNTATLSQLRQHPYINYYVAKTITEHRRLHGRISSLSDLKLYRDFTPEVIKRLENYVEF